MQLRPYQEEAVAAVYDHLRKHDDNPCVVLPTGCHAIDHPIRMYDGSIRRVQDVRVGELLMGEDSTPRRVLALCRGREPMARVLPADGEPFVVNQNHILSLRNARSEVVNLTVQAYRRQSPDWQRGHHLWRVRSGRVIEHVPFRLAELPEDDFYGFALDGNHLYLDGNDVVHHNTGKSLVLARIATDAVQLWSGRVLILAHVKELLEQNADKIQRLCPGLQIGIYSAGLKRRDTDHAVIVAGIQSVYTRAREFGPFDLAIVDEAHTIPGGKSGEGMYRQFLEAAEEINPNLRVIGLTATPYRLKGGEICQADNVLNAVCYEANIRDMIMQGYLSKLRSRSGTATADLSQVEVRGGEFVASAMEAAMDRSDLVKAACQEIVELSRDRCSVLLFTAGVAHCEHVAREIEQLTGDACGIVTGETPADERAEILARFRGEDCSTLTEKKPPLKYLANVNVLTTGFDATAIDCVVMLRPTMSTGLYVQMVGRGTRLHAGKEDCLVLDYAGNVQRHGPLDLVEVHSEGGKEKKQATSKECPNCNARIDVSYRFCPHCQFCFPPPEPPKLDVRATTAEITRGR